MNQGVFLKNEGNAEFSFQLPFAFASENLTIAQRRLCPSDATTLSFDDLTDSIRILFFLGDEYTSVVYNSDDNKFLQHPLLIVGKGVGFALATPTPLTMIEFRVAESFFESSLSTELFHFFKSHLYENQNIQSIQLSKMHVLEFNESTKNLSPNNLAGVFLQMVTCILNTVFKEYSVEHLKMNHNDVNQLFRISKELASNTSLSMNIDQIATEAGMSTTKFKNSFKKLFGQSPYSYFLSHKMDYAKGLIQNEDKSIAEVSASLGYNNTSNFTKIFKKYTTQLPSKMKR